MTVLCDRDGDKTLMEVRDGDVGDGGFNGFGLRWKIWMLELESGRLIAIRAAATSRAVRRQIGVTPHGVYTRL